MPGGTGPSQRPGQTPQSPVGVSSAWPGWGHPRPPPASAHRLPSHPDPPCLPTHLSHTRGPAQPSRAVTPGTQGPAEAAPRPGVLLAAYGVCSHGPMGSAALQGPMGSAATALWGLQPYGVSSHGPMGPYGVCGHGSVGSYGNSSHGPTGSAALWGPMGSVALWHLQLWPYGVYSRSPMGPYGVCSPMGSPAMTLWDL